MPQGMEKRVYLLSVFGRKYLRGAAGGRLAEGLEEIIEHRAAPVCIAYGRYQRAAERLEILHHQTRGILIGRPEAPPHLVALAHQALEHGIALDGQAAAVEVAGKVGRLHRGVLAGLHRYGAHKGLDALQGGAQGQALVDGEQAVDGYVLHRRDFIS